MNSFGHTQILLVLGLVSGGCMGQMTASPTPIARHDVPSPDVDAAFDGVTRPDGGLSDATQPDGVDRRDGGGTDAAIPTGDDGLLPRIYDFRVQSPSQNRIYFNSSEALAATDSAGFAVSGKLVTGVTIVPDSGTGHYLTVSEPFTYWDNTTIRYAGGGDIRDREGNGLPPFVQEYVANLIPEPEVVGQSYYVSTAGSDSNDGLSEERAFRTLTHALSSGSAVSGGDIVHVRAGDYGAEQIRTEKNSGAGPNDPPLYVVGYRATPGDDPDAGWSHPDSTTLDPTVMPLFRGDGSGRAFQVFGDNLIFRNLQIQGYASGFYVTGSPNRVQLRNIISSCLDMRLANIEFNSDSGFSNRVEDTVVHNGGTQLLMAYGSHFLVSGVTAIHDTRPRDYYIVTRGNNNIVRHSYLERAVDSGHGGHGLSVKSVDVPTEYGLFEHLELVGLTQALEARHSEVRFNVYRDILLRSSSAVGREASGGIQISNGANNNIFDRIRVFRTKDAIRFIPGTEDTDATSSAHDNLIINSVFAETTRGVVVISGRPLEAFGNRIVNSVFYSMPYLILSGEELLRDNTFVNCQFVDIPLQRSRGVAFGFSFDSCNMYRSWDPLGTTNMSVDPAFTDPESFDFHLTSASPARVRTGGRSMPEARYDFDGRERPDGEHSIGAFR